MENPVDLTLILNWPQACVATVLILAVIVWPGVLAWLNSRTTRRTNDDIKTTLTQNNGGSSVKDALDRIEGKLDEHSERLAALEGASAE